MACLPAVLHLLSSAAGECSRLADTYCMSCRVGAAVAAQAEARIAQLQQSVAQRKQQAAAGGERLRCRPSRVQSCGRVAIGKSDTPQCLMHLPIPVSELLKALRSWLSANAICIHIHVKQPESAQSWTYMQFRYLY